jgi:NADH-quinone oxidoreductase subunit J
MNTAIGILYAFEGLAAISAIAMLFTRNVLYGTLFLIVCLLALAGIYVMLSAEFIAATQILIYAGGILVLIIFGLMLTTKFSGKPLAVNNRYVFAGLLAGMFFLSLLTYLFSSTSFQYNPDSTHIVAYSTINQIGIVLLSDYVLPFEIAGIVLLVALIGAAVTASEFNSTKKQ